MSLRSSASHCSYLLILAGNLGLGTDLRPVPDAEAQEVVSTIQDRFGAVAPLAWWQTEKPCLLPRVARPLPDGLGYQHLPSIVPDPQEPVWFVTEDWTRKRTEWCLFESHGAAIQELVEECYGCEYLIVSKELEWLVGETDNDVLFAVGEPVVERLRKVNR
ncbi:MAG: DUF6756 family protein [Anaerolineales bacterium]